MPPTDERYLESTHEEIVTDYWANRLWDDPKIREREVINDSFDEDLAAFEAEIAAEAARQEAEREAAAAKETKAEATPLSEEPPPDPGDWVAVVDEKYA